MHIEVKGNTKSDPKFDASNHGLLITFPARLVILESFYPFLDIWNRIDPSLVCLGCCLPLRLDTWKDDRLSVHPVVTVAGDGQKPSKCRDLAWSSRVLQRKTHLDLGLALTKGAPSDAVLFTLTMLVPTSPQTYPGRLGIRNARGDYLHQFRKVPGWLEGRAPDSDDDDDDDDDDDHDHYHYYYILLWLSL